MFAATFDPDDNESQLPFFEIPTTIAPGIEGITIKPADIELFWGLYLKRAVKEEANSRMWKYVDNEEQRRNAEADVTKKEDEATNKRREANAQRTEPQQRRSGR